jgi:hypothetical protein
VRSNIIYYVNVNICYRNKNVHISVEHKFVVRNKREEFFCRRKFLSVQIYVSNRCMTNASRWNGNNMEQPKYSKKTLSRYHFMPKVKITYVHLSTTYSTPELLRHNSKKKAAHTNLVYLNDSVALS